MKIFKILTLTITTLLIFSTSASFFAQADNHDISEDALLLHVERKLEYPHDTEMLRVQFKEDTSDLHILSLHNAMGHENALNQRFPKWLQNTPFERVRYVKVDGDMAEEMMKYYSNDYVQQVDPVYTFEILDSGWSLDGQKAYPNDWDSTKHWYFENTKLPELWYQQGCHEEHARCGGSEDVIVAVIDTGLGLDNYTANFRDYFGNTLHENIVFGKASEQMGVNLWTNQNVGGWSDACNDVHGIDMEMWVQNTINYTVDQIDCSQDQFAKEGQPNDDQGHGTFVSGIIASATNNGAGSVGMAHNVSIMTIKANAPFKGQFRSSSIELSIYYAAFHGADVINMSLGGASEPADSYKDAIDYAISQGVVIVAASGNSGHLPDTTGVKYPAALPNVIAVGAVNSDNSRSAYSDYGPEIDFVAPVGDSLPSTWHQTLHCSVHGGCTKDSNFTTYDHGYKIGTSFASPQVAAAAGLIKSFNKNLTPAQVKDILIATVTDIPPVGKNDETGYGVLNLKNIAEYIYTPLETFTLTYTAGPNGYIEGDATQLVLEGNNGSPVTASSNTGYHFANWSDYITANPRTDTNVQGNITVTANFEATKYTITFDPQGGSVSPSSQKITYNENVGQLPTPTRNGYSFVEWNTNANGAGTRYTSTTTFTQTKNITLYAIWEKTTSTPTSWVSYGTGFTRHQFEMAEFNNRLYQVHVGLNKRIYTRSSSNGENWTNWRTGTDSREATNHAVTITPFKDRLYQVHIGLNERIYTRSSSDGVNWTNWSSGGDPREATRHTVNMVSFNNRLYQVHVGLNRRIYTRSSSNGVNWTNWSSGGDPREATNHPISIEKFGDRLYQVHVGLNERIYTRSSSNGVNWTNWSSGGDPREATRYMVTMAGVGNTLYQTHVGLNNRIYTRSSTNGVSWGPWRSAGGPREATNIPVSLGSFNGFLYQGHVGFNQKMYMRVYE